MKKWFIYKITNPAGRVYIGRTCDFYKRKTNYKCVKNCKKQIQIYRSLVKYGYSNHTFEIIDSFESDALYMKGKERFWIRTYMSHGTRYNTDGMNCSDGGGGITTRIHSPEAIAKLKETKRKFPRIVSDEEKLATSIRMKGHKYNIPGKKAPPGWVEKMRLINKGKKYLLGRKQSPEQVKARADRNRGRKVTQNVAEIFKALTIKNSKCVLQYDLDGNFISEFCSIATTARCTGLSRASISGLLRGKRNHVGGFVFKFKDTKYAIASKTKRKEPKGYEFR